MAARDMGGKKLKMIVKCLIDKAVINIYLEWGIKRKIKSEHIV